MTLAICTPACGRSAITRRTLEAFMGMNPGAQAFPRFMALDHYTASEDQANAVIGTMFGWKLCGVAIPPRNGLMWAMRELVVAALNAGCDQMLWLENDWECVRPLVGSLGLTDEIDCVRLYHEQKQADGARPAGILNMVTGLPIPWQFCGRQKNGEAWESAKAHFGGAPSIIDLSCLAPFVDRPTMKDMAMAMGELRTIRPTSNYFWHIGHETTPGFLH